MKNRTITIQENQSFSQVVELLEHQYKDRLVSVTLDTENDSIVLYELTDDE